MRAFPDGGTGLAAGKRGRDDFRGYLMPRLSHLNPTPIPGGDLARDCLAFRPPPPGRRGKGETYLFVQASEKRKHFSANAFNPWASAV